ncbi:metal ABC transporter substrate-binding protein [Priestia flexa]|uniref:Metal ABC transporter substrate-binding protein n=1 Tax=Priestia flexa TaxID=86664 RepID=A0A8I1MES0_9BACI|nr:metal ABC transporter substrate-binding protein [Priestia flexa]MBN8251080.1 metal ABC transporter substrate-binding protein [Priestia flexa]RIV07627.1 metal ABC transporter substrate-binding protein [Priestia flexa]
MKLKIWLLSVISLLVFTLVACSSGTNGNEANSDKLKVVTTYSIIYDIVNQIGGEKVEIHSLVPIGKNPHEYDPLPEDVMKMTDADAVFYNGLNLEEGGAWFNKLLKTADKSGENAPVYRVSEGVKPIYLETKGLEKEPDPHAWMNIENGILYAENVKKALIKEDPDNKEFYEKNAKEYIAELQKLHDDTLNKIQQLPKEKRFLISSEGAFKYFGNAYGINTGYIWEINSESQGTPDQIRDVVSLIETNNIPALFVETSVDKRSMETVSKETQVPIAGTIFTDSLGKPGEDGDTYLKMMKWNTETIINGLQE